MASVGYPIFSLQGVPAAGTYGSTFLDLKTNGRMPANLSMETQFIYGSGGTTFDVYLQTSFDNGTTWMDVINQHFTTSSAKSFGNVSRTTAVVPFAPTDGTLASNTKNDGVFGPLWRAKIIVVGTYSGTTFRVDLFGTP